MHDLARILAVASDMARPDVTAHALAASCGPVRDALGRGEQLNVEPPGIRGVHSLVVLSERGAGADGPPHVASFAFAVGNRPRLREVEAVFGAGSAVKRLDWEPRRLTMEGPSSDRASVLVIVTMGGGQEPLVSDISLRRDALSSERFNFTGILAKAFALSRLDASARDVALSLGAAREVIAGNWIVDRPKLSGVASVVVRGNGPEGAPVEVLFSFAEGNRPQLRAVEFVFGKGTVMVPVDFQPWRWAFKGLSNADLDVKVVASTTATRGDEENPAVHEIALQREPRR
jgi:hypothetical protein